MNFWQIAGIFVGGGVVAVVVVAVFFIQTFKRGWR